MPTWRITAPDVRGKVQKGQSFKVISTTTSSEPDAKDIEEVLVINGYDDNATLSYRSPGNWKCEIISKDHFPGWDQQHEKYLKIVNKKNEKVQSDSASKEEIKSDKKKKYKSADNNEDNGYCVKIIFTIIPFLPVWWILKLPISLITYPFRKICSSKNNNLFPSYSFKKF